MENSEKIDYAILDANVPVDDGGVVSNDYLIVFRGVKIKELNMQFYLQNSTLRIIPMHLKYLNQSPKTCMRRQKK